MHLPIAMLVAGLIVLAVAADRFVLAAARLARAWGVPAIVVGALVVGMGTSAPELLVSGLAAANDQLDLAIGNAVGSNVANVTLVLGATAVFVPLAGSRRILRREGLLMLVAVSGLAAALFDLHVALWEGAVLLAAMILVALAVVVWARSDAADPLAQPLEPQEPAPPSRLREAAIGVVSLGATLAGADLLVEGGTRLALAFGIPAAFVGLTVVAVGTSLPELATSLAGIRRNEQDLVLGNVLGSNIFNALAVAGLASVLAPGAVDPSFRFASLAMVAVAVVAGLLAWSGRELVRWEGLVLLATFAAFVYASYG